MILFTRRFCRGFCLALLLTLALSSTRKARAEIIRNFDVAVHLRADASLDVTENIAWDFGKTPRHGIYRDIPTQIIHGGKTLKIALRVLSVTDEKGKARKYVQSQRDGEIDLKIGDAKVLIHGLQIYRIHYVVVGAVRLYRGLPMLGWNVTGDQWPLPVQNATARFYAPPKTPVAGLRTEAFRGVRGSQNKAQTRVEKDCVVFSATNLRRGEGLTFFVLLPKLAFLKSVPQR